MFIDATNGLIKTVENFYIEGKVNGQKAVKKIINIYELKTLEWWISRLMLKLRFTKPKIMLTRIRYPRKKFKIQSISVSC